MYLFPLIHCDIASRDVTNLFRNFLLILNFQKTHNPNHNSQCHIISVTGVPQHRERQAMEAVKCYLGLHTKKNEAKNEH